jgi:hypothetical protein
MSDAYLTLDSGGLDDDSLERVHFANIAHKGGWSVVKLGLELRQSGRGELCGKLGPGCNVVALLSEEVVGVGSDFSLVLAYDVDVKFLGWEVSEDSKKGHTKISSDLSLLSNLLG